VQSSAASTRTFSDIFFAKKIAELLDFVASFLKMIEKLKIADLSPNWTIFSRAKVL
jgi:hypothetical protein